MRRFTSFVVGAMCGALVGSAAALLLTPASGEDIRVRLQNTLQSFGDDVRSAYEKRMAELEEELAILRSDQPEGVE